MSAGSKVIISAEADELPPPVSPLAMSPEVDEAPPREEPTLGSEFGSYRALECSLRPEKDQLHTVMPDIAGC